MPDPVPADEPGRGEQVEDRLAAAHRFLWAVLDSIPLRIFWKDRAGRYLGCNDRFARDAGAASARTLIGRNDAELSGLADAALYRQDDREVMESGQAKLAFEESHTNPDGTRLWLRTSKVPLRNGNGDIIGVLGAYDDITQWKEAEDRLRERDAVLDAIFSQAGDAIELADLETLRLVEFNDAGPRMLGYSREEYARLRVPDIVADLSEADIRERGARAKVGDCFRVSHRHRRKDGSFINVQLALSIILHRNRKHWIAVWSDISERLQVQEWLRQQVAFTEAVIEAEVDGLAVSHAVGDHSQSRFTIWNRAMAELTGYTQEEINALGWEQAMYDSPADQERSRQRVTLLRQGIHLMGEERLITRKDGQKRAVKLYSRFVSLPGAARHLLLVAHDITEQKRDELKIAELTDNLERRVAERTAQLQEAQRELKMLNESLARQVAEKVEELRERDSLLVEQARHAAMGEMVGNIAHQWRQPLSILSLVIQNLHYDSKEGCLTENALESYIARARHAIGQMTDTIDKFRDFFKPSRGPEMFSPLRIVEHCQELLAASLAAHGIELAVGGAADIVMRGYPGEFSQIILNLVGNAKDAMLERGVAHGRIAIEVAARQGGVAVAVADNAGGIAGEHMEKIFDPYFTTKSKGAGIGLYMAKTIIEQHMYGSIRAENDGAGARFCIEMPTAPTATMGDQK